MQVKGKAEYTYEYPRPALTVDVVIASRELTPQVLLIRRSKPPFEGDWALPGGFVDPEEKLVDAAKRELHEEAGIKIEYLEQIYAAGEPGRDPRGWSISVIFLGLVNQDEIQPLAGDDAGEVGWFSCDSLPKMAFDHHEILMRARAILSSRLP